MEWYGICFPYSTAGIARERVETESSDICLTCNIVGLETW